MNPTAELDATYYGFIGSTFDALILFEACIAGQIKHVFRRPQDRERGHIIQSGKIFIYEETTSGIKRWTDGISWSPSRILGNFLIYRQLAKAFGPGEKKKAIKKSKVGPNAISGTNQNNGNGRQMETLLFGGVLQPSSGTLYGRAGTLDPEIERALIGSLTDSYDFLEDGLVKKTISVTCEGVTHHLVSYYTIADVMSQRFLVPSKDPRFQNTYPRPSLLTSQNYRSPIQDTESLDPSSYPRSMNDSISQGAMHAPCPIMVKQETFSNYIGTTIGVYNSNYSMPPVATPYEKTVPAYTASIAYPNHDDSVPDIYPATLRPDQCPPDYRQYYVAASNFISDQSHMTKSTACHVQHGQSNSARRSSEDSGVSMSMDNKNNDIGYFQSQSSSYGVPRGSPLNRVAFSALPSLSKPGSGRETSLSQADLDTASHSIVLSMESKDMWQTGNACAGHGHYRQI